jgi:3-hydroxyisobutyrate dehydrogenase
MSDLVIVAVVDAAQTEAVRFGDDGVAAAADGAGAARPAPAVLLCPTIAPGDVERFAAGLDCLDAPMSGGPARARDGTVSLMVACDDGLADADDAALIDFVQRRRAVH